MAITTTVDYAGQVLADVRRQIAVDDDVLSETKRRRNLVKSTRGASQVFSRRSTPAASRTAT